VKRFAVNFPWIFFLLLALISLVVGGCGSLEPENASARPWNSPATWETGGMPSSMTEGH
jgi:hypothetical protein